MKSVGEYYKNLLFQKYNATNLTTLKINTQPVKLYLERITIDGQIKISFNQNLIIPGFI